MHVWNPAFALQSPVAFQLTSVDMHPTETTLGKASSDFMWMNPLDSFQYLSDCHYFFLETLFSLDT